MNQLITQLSSQLKIKSKSIISTIFGDIVQAHGGKIWLENLTQICQPLGINERLVRTSLYRLSEDDWLRSSKQGRCSYYQLTDYGIQQTAQAEQKIYYHRPPQWDGQWTLVFLVIREFSSEHQRQIEKQLTWMGFGLISRHVWGHPNADDEQLQRMIKQMGLHDSVVCMRAQNLQNSGWNLDLTDKQLAEFCNPMDEIVIHYKRFINLFTEFKNTDVTKFSPMEQLVLRVLLIDEYRKIILKDPYLAPQLLPENWVGEQAYQLSKSLYRQLLPATDQLYINQFLPTNLVTEKNATLKHDQRFVD